MNKGRLALTVLLALAAGVGAFAATRATRPAVVTTAPAETATEPLLDWLNATTVQRQKVRGHDPTFAGDLKKLREDLLTQRAALAKALEADDSSDELITGRVEAVIAASNALERRITRYLLTVRDHLTPAQRRQLFGLCAEGVREGPGWGWRRGGGGGMGRGGGRGPGPHGMGRMRDGDQ